MAKQTPLPVKVGVRGRLFDWIEKDWNRAKLLCRSCGCSFKRISKFASQHRELPSLREALAIEVMTEGYVKVIDWIDTSAFEEHVHRKNQEDEYLSAKYELNHHWWNHHYSKDGGEHLRRKLLLKLSNTYNTLHIETHLGKHPEQAKALRIKLTEKYRYIPCTIDEDASEQEARRAKENYARRRLTIESYRRGFRRDYWSK